MTMTKLETLLIEELREATTFLAGALYGQFDEPRKEEAREFLRRVHDSEESIERWLDE